MKTCIYIAGSMTIDKSSDYQSCELATSYLRRRGYDVENPAESAPPDCGTWQGWMRGAITKMMRCNLVVMLPNWGASKGACIERQLAIDLGIEVTTFAEIVEA